MAAVFVVPDLLMIQTGQCFKDIYPVFEAFDTLRQRAKAGDTTAQYRLSLRHLAGVHQTGGKQTTGCNRRQKTATLTPNTGWDSTTTTAAEASPKTPKPRTNGWTKQQRRADAIPAIKSA